LTLAETLAMVKAGAIRIALRPKNWRSKCDLLPLLQFLLFVSYTSKPSRNPRHLNCLVATIGYPAQTPHIQIALIAIRRSPLVFPVYLMNSGSKSRISAGARASNCSVNGCHRPRSRHASRRWKNCAESLRRAVVAATPNPSLKRSANGRPPGPVWRYAVHFRQPGPGVLPLSPA
jgi:hypothetical protein